MSKLGRYLLIERLPSLDGTLYRAADVETDAPVLLNAYRFSPTEHVGELDSFRDRFEVSLAAAMRLDHPAIARVLGGGQDGEFFFVASEPFAGENLATILAREPRSLSHRLRLFSVIAAAIASANELGVIHGAIHPERISVDENDSPRVHGFGPIRPPMLYNSSLPGPLRAYFAPEQLHGLNTDSRTDLFALGVLLYEMVAGRKPFTGETWIEVGERILHVDPISLEGSDLPGELIQLISCALAKNPRDRNTSAAELSHRVNAIAARIGDGTERSTGGDTIETSTGEHSGVRPTGPHLRVDDGIRKTTHLLTDAGLRIGRTAQKNDVVIDDDHISRQHAAIVQEDGRWILLDGQSKHGVYLNGKKVKRATLTDGDRIRLGHVEKIRVVFVAKGDGSRDTPRVEPVSSPIAHNDFAMLTQVVRILSSPHVSFDVLLHTLVQSALTISQAERGIVLLKESGGEFRIRQRLRADGVDPRGRDETEEKISMSVVDRCIHSGREELLTSPDFEAGESAHDLQLKTILCLPMVYQGNVRGVLYLDSQTQARPFDQRQRSLLLALTSMAAGVVENRIMLEQAIVDSLTGLFKKDYFEAQLEAEFHRAQRYGSPLSVLFLDIDHFKQINDTYDHLNGDHILRAVGNSIRSVARNTDVAARYGGEEFILLAPETTEEMAAALAERLRQAIAALRFEFDGKAVRLTVSLGVACYPGPGLRTGVDLAKAADRACLSAKREGRNRVVRAPRDGV